MGQIASTYDIMPKDMGVDLQAIIRTIPSVVPTGIELRQADIKPVAFGLKKVVAFFVVDDSDNSIGSKLEIGLRSIDGVGEVECVDSTVL